MHSGSRYEIKDGDQWFKASKATEAGMKPGWLHWQLRDGTVGLARPGTWRKVEKEAKRVR